MVKYKSSILKGFILLFIAFLCFPNLGLMRGQKNVAMIAKENRKITVFPKVSLNEKSFYSGFEKWYQDRLRYRDKMIFFWTILNFDMGVVLKDHLFVGKNDWLFNKGRFIKGFRDAETKVMAIKKLQTFCESKNKEFIFLLSPPKESVYEDYFPQREKNKQKDYLTVENQLIDMCKKYQVNYLPLGKATFDVRKISSNELYFYDDHHWNYYGSFIGAQKLLGEIGRKTQLRDYKIMLDGSTREAFKEFSYAHQLGLPRSRNTVAPWNKEFTDEIYVTNCYNGKTKKVNKILSNDTLWGHIVKGEAIIHNKGISENITLLMLGDSQGSYMMPYLSQKIHKIISTHFRDCVDKKKTVDVDRLTKQYNPDVIVLEIGGPNFFNSKGNSNFKNIVF